MSLLFLKNLLKVASTSPKDNFKVPLMTFKGLQGLTLNAQSNLICLLVLYNSLILPQQDNPSHSTNSTSMFLLQDFAFPPLLPVLFFPGYLHGSPPHFLEVLITQLFLSPTGLLGQPHIELQLPARLPNTSCFHLLLYSFHFFLFLNPV